MQQKVPALLYTDPGIMNMLLCAAVSVLQWSATKKNLSVKSCIWKWKFVSQIRSADGVLDTQMWVLPRGYQLIQMRKDIAWPHCTRTPKRSCCPDLSTQRCSSAKFVQISLCKCWYFSQGGVCRTQAVKVVLIYWTADQFAAKHEKHTFHCTGLRSHCDVKKACLPGGSLFGKGIAEFLFSCVNSPVGAHLIYFL